MASNNLAIYRNATKSAASHPILYHYTSFDSLKKIVENRSLRLNRLDKVNDPEEGNRIKSLWKDKIFVTCFTYTLKNADYFWTHYGKVRISFLTQDFILKIFSDDKCTNALCDFKKDCGACEDACHRTYETAHDWCTFDISIGDIFYTDDLRKYIGDDRGELFPGLIKLKNGFDRNRTQQNWEIEAETRIRVAVRPIGVGVFLNKTNNKFSYYTPPFDSLYLPLPNRIMAIDICPYCPPRERGEIADYLAIRSCKNNLSNIIKSLPRQKWG